MKNKVIIGILLISLAISVYYNVKYITDNGRKAHVVFSFAYSYINDVDQGLKQLKNCHSTGDYKNLSSITGQVADDFYSLDQLLSDGAYLVDEKKFYTAGLHDFREIGRAVEGGLKDKGYQGSFAQDGVLSENEVKFIDQLSADLEALLSAMAGKDGLNVNPDLTVESFTNTLKAFSDKWNIGYGRLPSGFSPYEYLKGK